MKLYDEDELQVMLDSAQAQECKDSETKASCERFVTILDSLEQSAKTYLETISQAREILKKKLNNYAHRTNEWDEL